MKTAFVLGNGVSRRGINPELLKSHGTIYGCNGLYREFSPDYLIAVDEKMLTEIDRAGYQHDHSVWSNKKSSTRLIQGVNWFNPNKGWSSGPTALWLASQHDYNVIYILGFDYKGLENGKTFNNIYADTENYKKSQEKATYYGNWVNQTKTVIKDNCNIQYVRVIPEGWFVPDEFKQLNNLSHLSVEKFRVKFGGRDE